MIMQFEDEYYKLLKSVDLTAIQDYIKLDDINHTLDLEECNIMLKDGNGDYFEESSVNVLLGCIDDEICMTGLSDDQNEVLPRGRQLYALYDGIYYSLPVKKGE